MAGTSPGGTTTNSQPQAATPAWNDNTQPNMNAVAQLAGPFFTGGQQQPLQPNPYPPSTSPAFTPHSPGGNFAQYVNQPQMAQPQQPQPPVGAANRLSRTAAPMPGIQNPWAAANSAPATNPWAAANSPQPRRAAQPQQGLFFAGGGTIPGGGLGDLYGTPDGQDSGPISQDGYGLGRLNTLFSGGAPGFADGGMLDGPGDGMSDSIPATINGDQPAKLADGEFVVPADVVSHLGNGSTKAGAKHLYDMLDRVRAARTGTKMQGKQINPHKLLPR